MNTKPLTLLPLLAICSLLHAQEATPPSNVPPVKHTVLTLQLSGGDDFLSKGENAVGDLMLKYSNESLASLMKTKYKLEGREAESVIKVVPGDEYAQISITVDLKKHPEIPGNSSEIATEIQSSIENYLTQFRTTDLKARLKEADENEAQQSENQKTLKSKLEKIDAEYKELLGVTSYPGSPLGDLQATYKSIQNLKTESLAKKAREDATEEAIARLSEQMKKQIDADPVSHELQQLVDSRQKRLSELGPDNPAVKKPEFIDAIAEARVRLLERQKTCVTDVNESLNKLNQELINLSIDRRELEVRLSNADDQLKKINRAMELDQKRNDLNASWPGNPGGPGMYGPVGDAAQLRQSLMNKETYAVNLLRLSEVSEP